MFQDVAAIPLLALLPALAMTGATTSPGQGALAALRVIVTIAAVVIGGRYLLRPMFRAASRSGAPETFTAMALLVVIGTAWIMDLVGISMSLGAFIAGVLLADSEYRHEIEAQIEPFKGLLLGLFFVSVGMSLDVDRIVQEPQLVGTLLVALLAVKGIVLYAISRFAARDDNSQSIALAAVLAQGGEFAFNRVHGRRDERPPRSRAARSADARRHAVDGRDAAARAPACGDDPARSQVEEGPIASSIASKACSRVWAHRGLRACRPDRGTRAQRTSHPFAALEHDAEQVDFVRRFGNKVFYGDATRLDLLRAAQADKAEIFVIATENPEENIRTARLLKRHFPHLKVFARARNRQHVFRLMDLNVEEIVRDTFYSSLELTRYVLLALGYDAATAQEHLNRFREHDERVLANQYPVYDDETALLQTTKEAREDLQRLFEVDSTDGDEEEEEESA